MPLIEVIAKDGSIISRFEPNGKQLLFAINKAKNPHLSDDEVCDMMAIKKSAPTEWYRKYGTHYKEWLDEALDTFGNDQEAKMLEAVGMMQALKAGNYQYWRDMARTKGVIKEEVKTQNITINTDFSAILLSGNVQEARQRILAELRGVQAPKLVSDIIEVEAEPVTVKDKATNSAV